MKNLIKKPVTLIWIAWAVIVVLIIFLFIMDNKPKTECEKAVAQYLQLSKDFEKQESTVTIWSNIVVDYIWRLKDWEVFDTSIESIARACWSYQEWRDYTQWLAFQAWAWQMIAWFDAWVIWMKVWETKTIRIPFSQAYWPRDKSRILKMDMNENFMWYKKWDQLMTEQWPIKVYDINTNEITFDTNHPLAGKDLIFDITIKQIQ